MMIVDGESISEYNEEMNNIVKVRMEEIKVLLILFTVIGLKSFRVLACQSLWINN